MINWKVTKKDAVTISKIVNRTIILFPKTDYDFLDLNMDITACHLNGCPLKLTKLLKVDDFNFAHDIFGISRHIDRSTGQLKDCFVPRCAK